jgi:hypothetical protein
MDKMAKRAVISTIPFSIFMMWLSPVGSFNPREPGFYTCILIAATTNFLTYKALKKYQVKKE